MNSTICITLDIDWATERIFQYAMDILTQYDIPITIFATDNCKYLVDLRNNLIDIGIHPNVNKINDIEKVIKELKGIFPATVSLRNHALVHSSRFFNIFDKYKIINISNYLMPFHKNIQPFKLYKDIVEFPIYFMDDLYLSEYKCKDIFNISSLKLGSSGMKVFCFHPIHVYLNTESVARYNSIKKDMNNSGKIDSIINNGIGIRNIFIDLLEYIKKHKLDIKNMQGMRKKYFGE
ncbi:MAG: hypothetical protein JW822_01340 [Spirochaetales bacterium]|nr:hypothetical protein [Spirochaetales bacterium]